MSIWDDPELKVNDDYVKFENVGDAASGLIISIRAHRFDDGKVVPQILIRDDADGEERTITAGQVRLKAELAEKRPEAGDHIRIALSSIEKRQGGKTLKHFDVAVTRGSSTPAAATPAATAEAPAAAGVPTTLTPEQVEALKAMGVQIPA